MIIPIDDNYRLSSDSLCWKVEKAGKLKGETVWTAVSWHASPGGAAKSLSRRLVRSCETETLQEAIDAVERIAEKLTRALTPRLSFEEV